VGASASPLAGWRSESSPCPTAENAVGQERRVSGRRSCDGKETPAGLWLWWLVDLFLWAWRSEEKPSWPPAWGRSRFVVVLPRPALMVFLGFVGRGSRC
ncbi:hypothetical protein H0E87_001847, partial [Populus deltoides]